MRQLPTNVLAGPASPLARRGLNACASVKDGKVFGSLLLAEGGGYTGSIAAHYTLPDASDDPGCARPGVAMGCVGYWLDDDGEPACSAEYPHGCRATRPRRATAWRFSWDSTALAIDQVAAIRRLAGGPAAADHR